MIDVGPASSNPKAGKVGAAEEIRRLEAVMPALKSLARPLSIDSFEPETQRWALAQGVDYLNDIQGFPNPELYPQLAEAPAKLVLMHSLQQAEKADARPPPQGDILGHICAYFEARLEALAKAGVDVAARVILDPGMGMFLGNKEESSFRVLAGIGELKGRFGLPVLISVSRKSFLRHLTGRDVGEAGPATLAAELLAVERGADFIRTHEPAPLRDALAVRQALWAQAP